MCLPEAQVICGTTSQTVSSNLGPSSRAGAMAVSRARHGQPLANWKLKSYFQAMLNRTLTRLLHDRLAQFSAVTLVGPRQCGKTTLARTLTTSYFNLEAPEEQTRLDARWDEVIAGDGLIVFDEAQQWPELFRRLR